MNTERVKKDLEAGAFDGNPELAKNVIRMLLDEVRRLKAQFWNEGPDYAEELKVGAKIGAKNG